MSLKRELRRNQLKKELRTNKIRDEYHSRYDTIETKFKKNNRKRHESKEKFI